LSARRAVLAAVLTLVATAGGCGGEERPSLTVSAAASLKNAFERYAEGFDDARTRYSFAGSDELAAQIRQGAKPDVFAAANTVLPRELFSEGLVERPVTFAGNRLVVAVPRSSTLRSLADLARPGLDVVVGSPSVPVGSYTRTVIERLPRPLRQRIEESVRSNEPDVASIVGKLLQGAGEAGFVYVTDVEASKGRLRALELPGRVQPTVEYGIAVVRGAEQQSAARAFVDGLLDGRGREALAGAGFEAPRR
jgi:molybdate transport system substrate-binding protein